MEPRILPIDETLRPFEFSGWLRPFRHAFRGLRRMIACQHNAWIHAVATIAVAAAGFVVRLAGAEWCWIILAIAGVWTAEH